MKQFKKLLTVSCCLVTMTAQGQFTSVNELPQGQDSRMSYMLTTPRGSLFSDPTIEASCLTSNCQTGRNEKIKLSATDARGQFLLFKAKNEPNGYYIYSVKAQSFLGKPGGDSGVKCPYVDKPQVLYVWKNGQSGSQNNGYGVNYEQSEYPFSIGAVDGTQGAPYTTINVCCWDQNNPDYRFCETSGYDAGNEYAISEAQKVNETLFQLAYQKVVEAEKQPETGTTDPLDPNNVLSTEERKTQTQAALDIINRFTEGTMKVKLDLSLCRTQSGCDRYTYSATTDKLTIKASSAVAACRGFYDYVKSKGAGFASWSGTRFQKPADMSCSEVSLTTQFRDHQYFNVVTYGYTVPFWDEARWDKELDWMALHGIDMPLMLVGAEQIYREVFYDMGLNKEEVDAWEVGPAHLPWFRMGNVAGNSFDGPLGEEWNEKQRKLAHHLLDRMRALGMKPICPAFGGFVPQAFTKHHSGKTELTGWNWVPTSHRNYRLDPGSAAFVEVGKRFIQKWEKEYGVGKYYLSDSFNEMIIPSSTATLTQYGDSIFKSIREGSANPDAVWVTQGWTFVYQSGQWGSSKFNALTQNIPDHRFMVLYMSPEYGPNKCWERYDGFNGKEWCYTMLPNMGGKTFWTGNFSAYANQYLTNLYRSTSKGRVTGYGLTPEGVENNEMLYELVCDAGWTPANGTIDLDAWMERYAQSRYGKHPQTVRDFLKVLRQTVYNKYIDHPRFGWQMGGNITGTGSASLADAYYKGVETLFAQTEELKQQQSPLLENELIEAAVLYACGRIENLNTRILGLKKNPKEAQRLIAELDTLMLDMDAALARHPLYNLKHWEDQAQGMADTPETKLRNARNARRIVTVWYGDHQTNEPVQDYAARIWSGLIRDFYRPRLIQTLKHKVGFLPSFNSIEFENKFVAAAPTLSQPKEIEGNLIDFLAQLVDRAKNCAHVQVEALQAIETSNDSINHWYVVRSGYEAQLDKVLTASGDYQKLEALTDVRDGYQAWRFIRTGENAYRLENRWGENLNVTDSELRTLYAHASSDLHVEWTSDDTHRFAILPQAAPKDKPALHCNGNLMLYGYKGNDGYYAGSLWTIEPMPTALVPEAKSEDYTRYIRRLTGFTQQELFGKPGQPVSADALNQAVNRLYDEAQNIDHKTYDTFLAQWAELWKKTFVLPQGEEANRLLQLIVSAHQLVQPADAAISTDAASLRKAILRAEKAVAGALTEQTTLEAEYNYLNQAILQYYQAKGGTVIQPGLPQGIQQTQAQAMSQVIYDLQGRAIDAAELDRQSTPQVYICNGKKMIK